MLPALTAALVGAVATGTATFLADSPDAPFEQGYGHLAAATQAPPGVLARPTPPLDTTAPAPSEPSGGTSDTTAEPTPSEPTPSSPQPASQPPATTPPPSSTDPNESTVDTVIDLVNTERAKAGCPELREDPRLTLAAQTHSADMSARDYFDHTTPDGVTFAERIVSAGYPTPGAENIAQGQESAQDVMNAWMTSDTHRANILDCDLATIGVGLETKGWYWTQDFGM